jgi:predicted flap endonuclease-1-like 5' DNA nuclease
MFLLSQIWIYLALAGLIGFFTGWWWGRCRCAITPVELARDRALNQIASLEAENAWLKAAARGFSGGNVLPAVPALPSREASAPRPQAAPAPVVSPAEAAAPAAPTAEVATPTPAGATLTTAAGQQIAISPVAAMDPLALEAMVMAAGAGLKPQGLAAAQGSGPDDLKEIGGIGPVNEKWLHQQGIFHFWQIASFDVANLAWLSKGLPNFGTRVYRENWVDQAARLARGEMTEAKQRYKDGKHS